MRVIYLFCLISLMGCTPLLGSEDVFLVVGSCRDNITLAPYAKFLFGDDTDFTHLKTFNGRATTLDINPCKLSKVPHIKADAATPLKQFTGKPIAAVFFEHFPPIRTNDTLTSIDLKKCGDDLLLMPKAIRNIAQYMKKGATLEIQHLPAHIFTWDTKFVEDLKTSNPFVFFLSPYFMESIRGRNLQFGSHKYDKHWAFLVDEDVQFSLFGWNYYISPVLVYLMEEKHQFVVQAIKNLEELLPKVFDTQGILDKEVLSYIEGIDPNTGSSKWFASSFHTSFSQLVALEFAILSQKEYIKTFLETNGFSKIEISRKDNPHNGCKNVLMITGVRNDDPITNLQF